MQKEDFTIWQKIYDLLVISMPIICKMPKSNRFILGQQIESKLLELLDMVAKINKMQLSERKKYFSQISCLLDSIQSRWQLAKDLKLVSIKQYLRLMEKTNEISKLIYNWLK